MKTSLENQTGQRKTPNNGWAAWLGIEVQVGDVVYRDQKWWVGPSFVDLVDRLENYVSVLNVFKNKPDIINKMYEFIKVAIKTLLNNSFSTPTPAN